MVCETHFISRYLSLLSSPRQPQYPFNNRTFRSQLDIEMIHPVTKKIPTIISALFKGCFKSQNNCISDFFCQMLLFLQKSIMPKLFQILALKLEKILCPPSHSFFLFTNSIAGIFLYIQISPNKVMPLSKLHCILMQASQYPTWKTQPIRGILDRK